MIDQYEFVYFFKINFENDKEKEIDRIGSNNPIEVDVRIIGATNQSLKDMVKNGTFREDLFYRINLIQIHLPALRERKEDISLLANFFAQKQTAQNRLPKVKFTSSTLQLLDG